MLYFTVPELEDDDDDDAFVGEFNSTLDTAFHIYFPLEHLYKNNVFTMKFVIIACVSVNTTVCISYPYTLSFCVPLEEH